MPYQEAAHSFESDSNQFQAIQDLVNQLKLGETWLSPPQCKVNLSNVAPTAVPTETWNYFTVSEDYPQAIISADLRIKHSYSSTLNLTSELVFPLESDTVNTQEPLLAYPYSHTKDIQGLVLNSWGQSGWNWVMRGFWRGTVPVIGGKVYWQLKRRVWAGSELALTTTGWSMSEIYLRINLLGFTGGS